MPLHKFTCSKCGRMMSKIVLHEERNAECQCGGQAKRVIATPSFTFDRQLEWKTE